MVIIILLRRNLVGKKRKENNPSHTGEEEYNFFLAVLFPDDQLKIFDYNWVVKDLNGQSQESYLENLSKYFEIEKSDFATVKPSKIREFAMYLPVSGIAHTPEAVRSEDPVADLDVTILSQLFCNQSRRLVI